MKKIFLISLFFCATQVFSQTADETKISAAVEALRVAMVNADKSALENLTSEVLSYGHSSGKVENRQEFVDNIVSGKSDFVKIDLSEQTVKVNGDLAIVRHKFDAETNDGGKPGTASIYILLVWHKEKKDWKLVARQAVKVPK